MTYLIKMGVPQSSSFGSSLCPSPDYGGHQTCVRKQLLFIFYEKEGEREGERERRNVRKERGN